MASPNPGQIRFKEISASAATPPVGYAVIYVKTDNVVYLKDSSGTEVALGSASSITALTGDVTATGPGSAVAVVVSVGGKTAAEIAQSVDDTQDATSANTAGTIVKRDGSGNIFISQINGIIPEAHASRHAPGGADAISTAAPVANLNANTTNAAGTGTSLSRNDHSHTIDTGTPTDVGSANSAGASANLIRADHVHKGVHSVKANLGTQRFGDLSLVSGVGVTVTDDGSGNFTLAASGGASELYVSYVGSGLSLDYTSGKVIFNGIETFISAGSVLVGASITNGYVYADIDGVVKSAASLPQNTVPLAIFTSGLSSITFLEDARVFLAQNLVWGIAADLQNVNKSAENAGASEKYSRADHKHDVDTASASSQTPNQANAEGSSSNLARADHIHNIPTTAPIANLTATTTNSDGAAATFSRSDHGHAIDTGTPSTQTPDQANATGTSTNLARADHIHNIPAATPVQIGTTNFKGAAASFALSDHVHDHGAQTSGTLHAAATTSVNGFMSAADKTKTDAELPTSLGTSNQVLGVNNAGTAGEYKSLVGTTNQITITDAVGSKTFATPQDIHTGATPTFTGENLTSRLEMTEQVAPSTPASTKVDIFVEASNGFSRLRYLDSTGLKSTILRDSFILAKNTTGSTIAAGKGVYYTGTDAGTNLPTIGLAKADSSSTVPCVGITVESIANNAVGRVMALGIVTNIDTSAFAQGDKLYLSATTAGNFTATKPTSPNIWQRIGIVLISNASTGAIEVRPFATHGEESGTNTAYTLNQVTLTDAATIAVDASLGNTFSVTLGGNRTLGAPTNPTDGQKIVFRIRQDGTGNRTLAFNAIYRFGLDIISFVASTGANKLDYIGAMYNSADSKWDIIAVSKGFN